MRKFLVTAVFTFVTIAMLAPPVLAQAPAPKVTITGLFDQVTSAVPVTKSGMRRPGSVRTSSSRLGGPRPSWDSRST